MRISNLQLRLITALFLAVLTLTISWAGEYFFIAFSLIIGAALYYEWQTLAHIHQTKACRLLGWLFYCLIAFLLFNSEKSFVLLTTIFVAAILLSALSRRRAGWIAGGFVYAAVAPVVFVLIRNDSQMGFGALIFLYAIVWGTDSAAYFSGKMIGGAKLVSQISPNKTWSGAIGGTISGIILGTVAAFFLFDMTSIPYILPLLAFVLSVASQIGDIGESWIKRHFNVKDSSNLLPGHGGFMDRLDGLVAASFMFYIIAACFSDADTPAVFFNVIQEKF